MDAITQLDKARTDPIFMGHFLLDGRTYQAAHAEFLRLLFSDLRANTTFAAAEGTPRCVTATVEASRP